MTNEEQEGSHIPPCPVCGGVGECAHYLIGIDLTFMDARGPLADDFLGAFARMMDLAPEADELEAFRSLTNHVRSWSQAENEYVEEGGPGMTSLIVDLFAKYPSDISRVEACLKAIAGGS